RAIRAPHRPSEDRRRPAAPRQALAQQLPISYPVYPLSTPAPPLRRTPHLLPLLTMGTHNPCRRPLAALALLLAPAVVLAQPASCTHDTGVTRFAVSDNGSLGSYADDAGNAVGTGFVVNGENGLFEGEVLVGRSSTQVSGDAYEYPDVE